MTPEPQLLPCDGCGQLATPGHIARRLQRLEWATRYRPIHMQVLFLGAVSPVADSGFLYAPDVGFQGEGAALLNALDLAEQGQENPSVLSDFQRRGYFLTHVLECPMNPSDSNGLPLRAMLQNRLPSVTSRILRSLKPKRIALISADLLDSLAALRLAGLGDILLLDGEKPFDLHSDARRALVGRLRSSL